MTLWFVTPAHLRYELSAVCFEQRKRVIDTLAKHGVHARCVVIADDENLDIARGLGFATVERDNEWLGRRFNDGMEYAGKHRAEWIVPIGSDSWIDPAYFLPLPDPGVTRTASEYVPVTGDRMAECVVESRSGAGPYVFHRNLLKPSGFRPAEDHIPRGVDGSTIAGIERTTGQTVPWERYSLHPYQYVGFRGVPHITRYDKLWAKWGQREHSDPWSVLAQHYPADLVERVREILPLSPPSLTDSRGLRWMGRRITHAYRCDQRGQPVESLCRLPPHPRNQDTPKAQAEIVCGKCRELSRRIPQRMVAA